MNRLKACGVWFCVGTLIGAAAWAMGPETASSTDTERSRARSASTEKPLPGPVSGREAELEALRDELGRTKGEQARLSAELQSIALDESRHEQDRRTAIFTLAELGDEESLDFLAKHIAMRVSVAACTSRDWIAMRRPCRYALGGISWAAIPPLLKQLATERSNEELSLTSRLLVWRLGRSGADAMLERERATSDLHRANLQKVRELLETP